MPAMFNLISSNIVGPQSALHLAGHELLAWYPFGILMTDIGLFVVFISYNGKFGFTFTVDPSHIPDVESMVAHLRASLAEMLEAAERAPKANARTQRRGRAGAPAEQATD